MSGARQDDAALVFTVGEERLAVPAAEVSEVLRVPVCTRVPNAPATLVGLASLRGAVLPVLSLSRLLGHEGGTEAADAAARVVVIAGASPVGLLVGSVVAVSGPDGVTRLDVAALLAHGVGTVAAARSGVRPGAGDGTTPAGRAAAVESVTLLGVRLAGQEYALPLAPIAEVMRLPAELLEVPHTGEAMIGVAGFRGGLLPVVSLRALLGLPAGDPDAGWRAVVARVAEIFVGLQVDRVTGILEVPPTSIDPVPPLLTRGAGEARLQGVCRLDGGRRLVGLLSAGSLFDAATAACIGSDIGQGPAGMPSPNTPAAAPAEGEQHFVVFRLGAEEYGVPIEAVDEVVKHPGMLTRLPQAPAFIEGVMNLRGRAIPVIDTSRRFGLAAGDGHGGRVVVLTVEGVQTGFAVDSVSEVLRVPSSALQPAPSFAAEEAPLFDRIALKRENRLILLISAKGLLREAERDLLASLAGAQPDGDPAGP